MKTLTAFLKLNTFLRCCVGIMKTLAQESVSCFSHWSEIFFVSSILDCVLSYILLIILIFFWKNQGAFSKLCRSSAHRESSPNPSEVPPRWNLYLPIPKVFFSAVGKDYLTLKKKKSFHLPEVHTEESHCVQFPVLPDNKPTTEFLLRSVNVLNC